MTIEEWLPNYELGQNIWRKKYQHGSESFDEWLDRISQGDYELRALIAEKKFLLGGRALANRGLDTNASLFNCYSRGYIEDDYTDIMQALKDIGLTFKGQGGQGVSLTKLRPKGTPISGGGESDGVVNVMEMLDEVTARTAQAGNRKGALMISLDALHKDIFDFIKIKSVDGEIEKANLSLEVNDEFMKAVLTYYQTGEIVTLHQKREYSGHTIEYDTIPIEVFNAMVDNCYDWGDPACLYVDKFRNYNLMQYHPEYKIETANPCKP